MEAPSIPVMGATSSRRFADNSRMPTRLHISLKKSKYFLHGIMCGRPWGPW